MNKAELESKHLSELHALAADAGVERYRMLPRAELIEKLADGEGGGSAGGGAAEARPSAAARRASAKSAPRAAAGATASAAAGIASRAVAAETASARGGDRPRGGGEPPAAPARVRAASAARARAGAGAGARRRGAGRPKRRRRRRRFRKGGKSVRAGELILAAPGGQSIVYGESRQSCTALLRELAAELSGGRGPDPVALLVDPSPEELADWKREAPKAEIVSAGQERHAEDALAQAARRAEGGEAVILLIDSVSRLAESFGSNVAKDLLEEARGAGGSGSLTIVAAVER